MRVVFGDWEFDSGRRILFCHGRAIPLSAKAFQLLELLLDRRPEVIAKGELLERLWPETFVSDASLHNLVSELRAALGDTPHAARYIRTLPRFGYAFRGDARSLRAHRASTPEPAAARLVSGHREWRLSEGTNLLGRDRDCAIRIASPTLSRHHACIVVTGGGATIEDLGSKNGTRVNHERVAKAVALKDRDEIEIGSVTITYRTLEPMSSTLTSHK